MKRSLRGRGWFVLLFLLSCLVSCSKSDRPRFHMTGRVTFQGQPVPAGNISFEPVEGGVAGGFASIQDGRYDTSQSGRGHWGGKHTVRITGNTGKLLKPNDPDSGTESLFTPYETTVDLPLQAATQDFDVPADGKPSLSTR